MIRKYLLYISDCSVYVSEVVKVTPDHEVSTKLVIGSLPLK